MNPDEVISVSPAARAKARAAAGRSMVLMKNDNALLPLSRVSRVAVIGPLATATYDLNGTWSGLGTGRGHHTAGDRAGRHQGGGRRSISGQLRPRLRDRVRRHQRVRCGRSRGGGARMSSSSRSARVRR